MSAGKLKSVGVILLGCLPLLAWAGGIGISPADLPRGETSLRQLEAEFERLAAGRSPVSLQHSHEASGSREAFESVDADNLTQGLRDARDPFLHFPRRSDAAGPIQHVAIIGPPDAAKRTRELLAERATARDITLATYPADRAAIPHLTHTDAALILALPTLDDDAQRELFRALRDAGVPSLALSDPGQVERGALLSVPGAVDEAAWLRRVALHLDDRARGHAGGVLGDWPEQGREWLNLATARALGWSPDFDLLIRARLFEASTSATGEGGAMGSEHATLRLEQAVALALSDNLRLAIARHELETQALDHQLARSRWRPNLYLEATGREIDAERASMGLGQQPQRRATAGATLEQLLFSEPALAALAITASLDRARRAELEVESLDLALDTAREFLDLLRLDAQLGVLREDLELTEANLQQAQRRVTAGAAGQEESLRFTSERAQARERLEQASAQRQQLVLALNRRLGRAADAALTPQAPDTGQPQWLAADVRFSEVVRRPTSLAQWQTALVVQAVQESRELQALAAGRSAAQRELESRQRAFWVPEVGLQVSYDHELYRDGRGDRAPWEAPQLAPVVDGLERYGIDLPATGEDEWSVGISARLPLYAGGRRSLERERSARRLESVTLSEEEARQGLETRLRAASVELVAAWRRIAMRETSRDNAVRARELVESGWREGASDLVTLLDAQATARQAQLAEVESHWQFLQALVHLQRALGLLPGPLSEADRNRLLAPSS